MRVGMALGAAVLALVAVVVSLLDHDTDVVPFFVALTVGASVIAWAASGQGRARRRLGQLLAVVWVVAAVWVGFLLIWYQVACGCSIPGPLPPKSTYLGLTATAYHVMAVYGGAILVALAAFWPTHSDQSVGTE